MTIAVSSVLSRAFTLLLDETAIRWPRAELLNSINDGVLEMAVLNPLLFTGRATMPLEQGVYQTIPAGKRHLNRIISNTTGSAVRMVTQGFLDVQDPNWYSATSAAPVRYIVLEQLNSKHFLCSPPNDGTGELDAIFTIDPPEYGVDDTIDLDSTYGNPLLSFVLYRAFLKDADTSDDARANKHYETFVKQMAMAVMGEAQAKPEAREL